MFKTYLFVQIAQRQGLGRFGYIRCCIEYGIKALQRSHPFANTIGRFAEVLGRVDQRIENYQIIDKRRSVNDSMVAEDEHAAKPENNGNKCRT